MGCRALAARVGRPALVRTVVENPVSNAVKFRRKRTLAANPLGGNPARGYFVRDNGVGFDPARATHLFSPFHRLHRAFACDPLRVTTHTRAPRSHRGTNARRRTCTRLLDAATEFPPNVSLHVE
jgi:hypothetical protein